MKKLKRKFFLVLFGSMSLVVIGLSALYNIKEYSDVEMDVKRTLTDMRKGVMDTDFLDEEDDLIYEERPLIYTDIPIAITIMDRAGGVMAYYTNFDEEGKSHLTEWTSSVLQSGNSRKYYIPNLYGGSFAYTHTGTYLVLLDLRPVRLRLWEALGLSLMAVGLSEGILAGVCWMLTRWMVAPVEEAFERQKQFIADSSHELKTPLAVIMASAQAAMSDPDIKWIRNIELESQRMSYLISQLLSLARSEKGVQKTFAMSDISHCIEMALLPYESVAFEKGFSLDYEIEPDVQMVCDAQQIKQVTAILLDNAMQHTYAGGKIILHFYTHRQEAILSVANEGDPINKEDEKHIFERFYRADASRNRQDNHYGLGLAIARNIAQNHNGSISVSRAEGMTVFTVKFKMGLEGK